MTRWLFTLFLGLAAGVFAVENNTSVHLVFLGMTAPAVHLAYVVLSAVALGVVMTFVLGGFRILTLHGRIGRLERDLRHLRSTAGLHVASLDQESAPPMAERDAARSDSITAPGAAERDTP